MLAHPPGLHGPQLPVVPEALELTVAADAGPDDLVEAYEGETLDRQATLFDNGVVGEDPRADPPGR